MPRFRDPPIKRHPALQPLSRDHYVALVQAQHLVKAASDDAAARKAALADFVKTWGAQIADHFDDEERLLIPLMTQTQMDRLQSEHKRLRSLAREADDARRASDPEPDLVRTLGQMLNDHTRWEERELFPAIEQSASADELKMLQDMTNRIEAHRPRNANARNTGD